MELLGIYGRFKRDAVNVSLCAVKFGRLSRVGFTLCVLRILVVRFMGLDIFFKRHRHNFPDGIVERMAFLKEQYYYTRNLRNELLLLLFFLIF